MEFDEKEHAFTVTLKAPVTMGLDFERDIFLTSLTTVHNVAAIQAAVDTKAPIWNSGLIPVAIEFEATCVVPGKPGTPLTPAQLNAKYEFGIIQGIWQSDITIDYWGKRRSEGRMVVEYELPNRWEVDTSAGIEPWIYAMPERYKLENAPKQNGVRVTAISADHPMYVFHHTRKDEAGTIRYLRSVTCMRQFRTIFCYRDRVTHVFTPISSMEWKIRHHHFVRYTDNGEKRVVKSLAYKQVFPKTGSPSNINYLDRKILDAAKNNGPFLTPISLNAMLDNGVPKVEEANADFEDSFWQ